MLDSNCIFCKIIKGEINSIVVYDDENIMAFLDIQPFQTGHTVVIPKTHNMNLFDFPDVKMNDFFINLKKIASKLKIGLNADGINILQNNFSAAGQVVNHMHFHIIPRWKGDMIPVFGKKKKTVSSEELQLVLKRINENQ